jgi:hypothetical protein
MADRELVLNDLLCYLFSQYGKSNLKSTKSILLNFYMSEDITTAKDLIYTYASKFQDVDKLLTHRKRRDNEDRPSLELDDIFAALAVLDEKQLLVRLPIFVTYKPSHLPTMHMGEGDLEAIMNRFQKMDMSISQLQSTVNKLAAVVSINRSTPAVVQSSVDRPVINKPSRSTGQLPGELNVMNEPSVDCLLSDNMTSRRSNVRWEDDVDSIDSMSHNDPEGEWETETTAMRRRLRKRRRRNRSQQLNNNTIMDRSNVSSHSDTGGSVAARDPHNKSRDQATPRQQPGNSSSGQRGYAAAAAAGVGSAAGRQQRDNRQQRQATPMLIGRRQCVVSSPSSQSISGRIVAAKPYIGKSVFCVDNVTTTATEEDIRRHVSSLGVTVLSCHGVQPRRSRWQRLNGIVPCDRSTFRLCIPREQSDKLLIADAWPANVTITAWRFTQKRVAPTEAGDTFYQQVTDTLRQQQQLSVSEKSLSTSRGTSRSADDHRIGMMTTTTANITASAIVTATTAAGSSAVGGSADISRHPTTVSSLTPAVRATTNVDVTGSDQLLRGSHDNISEDVTEDMDQTIIGYYDCGK